MISQHGLSSIASFDACSSYKVLVCNSGLNPVEFTKSRHWLRFAQQFLLRKIIMCGFYKHTHGLIIDYVN